MENTEESNKEKMELRAITTRVAAKFFRKSPSGGRVVKMCGRELKRPAEFRCLVWAE